MLRTDLNKELSLTTNKPKVCQSLYRVLCSEYVLPNTDREILDLLSENGTMLNLQYVVDNLKPIIQYDEIN